MSLNALSGGRKEERTQKVDELKLNNNETLEHGAPFEAVCS